MEQIVQILKDLQGVILLALPTAFLVIVLHWFLKKVLFQPLDQVIEERHRRTQGAVEASQAALATVKEKMAAYEKALGDARAEIFKENEAARKALAEQQAHAIEAARARAATQVAAAKAELAAEAGAARAGLRAESERLADQIAASLIAGGVQ
jgi:F-type H+-transporting ATPase subunit b